MAYGFGSQLAGLDNPSGFLLDVDSILARLVLDVDLIMYKQSFGSVVQTSTDIYVFSDNLVHARFDFLTPIVHC